MSKSDSDRRTRPNTDGPHSRSVRLSLKLAKQAVQETERVIERSRKVLDRPIHAHPPKRRDP
jgi:hypothetical protein